MQINAADLAGGNRFTFFQPQFDLICSDLSQLKVARAVAASSAVPGLFTPITLRSYAGQCGFESPTWFKEAGTAAQVFFYGFTLDLQAAARELGIQNRVPIRLFIVRNGKLTVPWQLVSPSILPIADRSLNGLIGSQVVGDLYRIYVVAQRDGIEFNLAYIPDDYDIGAQGALRSGGHETPLPVGL